jgi:hypothetical protein
MIGGQLIGHNDPDYQERVVKFNELIANAAIYSTALDITDAANALAAEGHPVDTDDLATITPCITRTIRRFGDWVLNLEPPDSTPSPASTCSREYCSPLQRPDSMGCRHSAATHPGDQKVPLQLIMAKTRHKSPRTAIRYVKPGDAAVAEVTSLLGPPRRSH